MQNTDTTFTWDSANHQTFSSPGVTILKGSPETFNKMEGCGLEVRGLTGDGAIAGPLFLIPDVSNESSVINWAAPSTSPVHSPALFIFREKSDFRILGNRQLRTTWFTSGVDNTITFSLYDDSYVKLEDLKYVILGMASLTTVKTAGFNDFLQPIFSISAEVVELFYNAELLGFSILDVQANVISTTRISDLQVGGLRFKDNAALVINDNLSQHIDSELRILSGLYFYNSSSGNITSRTIYNDYTDNNSNGFTAIEVIDQARVSIRTEQFLQGAGQGKIIQLSGSAQVTINPMNDIIPINPVEEMYHPTEKCWPGMINFKSGSKATLKLVGAALQDNQSVAALNSLKLVYVDGKPVDIASNFYVNFTDGITLMMK
ncbi:hypothetical protein [Escherichia sp. E13S3]|uniref:hypothetical protein n=1 Tax=Escherichia sp. E13S3 TaxID=2484854 RepID=UPI001028DC6E|nr:hypothetical protein [Escherichia sp. E13S3]RZN44928.1 hypothetical protein D9597_21430 [Escherichia sp. E13S3]